MKVPNLVSPLGQHSKVWRYCQWGQDPKWLLRECRAVASDIGPLISQGSSPTVVTQFQISLPLSFSHSIVVLFVDVVNPSSRPYAPAFKTQFWNGKCQWQYNPYTPSTCVVSQCCSAPGLTLCFFHYLTNMMMTTPHPTQYPFMLNIPQWLTGKSLINRMVYDVYGVCWFAYNLRTP